MPAVLRREVSIDAPRGPVRGVLTSPRRARAAVALGHGAGGTLESPLVAMVSHRLAARGFATLRYNFPFSEAGRRRPDFPRTLQATVVAAARVLQAHTHGAPLVIGGKSLGGRMSSHVAADGTVDAAGLLLLSYPLHPPRRPDELRVRHLPDVACPTLFVEGTRDPYMTAEVLDEAIARMRDAGVRVRLHVVDGGDHDLRTPVRLRRSYDDVVDEVADVAAAWLDDVASA